MEGVSMNWLYTLEDSLHPSKLNIYEEHDILYQLMADLEKEIKQFRPYFIEQLGNSEKVARIYLIQLIEVSNKIYTYLTKMSALWTKGRFPNYIRDIYRHILSLLGSLMEMCGGFDREIQLGLPLTNYSLSNIRIMLNQKFEIVRKQIGNSNIDKQLSELLLSGLQSHIRKKEMKKSDLDYACLILDRLEDSESYSTPEMENLLYQYDFNTPAFFNYCIINCNRVLLDTPSLHEQMEILIGFEDRINGLPPRTALRWMLEDISIREQLRVFLKEKKAYLHQRMELRRSEIEDHKLTEENERMEVSVPVTQLGVFVRLFMERGILPKEDVGRTFAHYARHYRTPKTSFISAESLQKKSTNIEYSTANKVKGHLIGMVNWLNEHHNTNRDKEHTS
ncbi:MAG: hypothetical protein BGP15_04285 [Sphingobacterium sp. 40-24]|uniref:hypothetical protein n=1 Tax=Sphingobacterium sp. 40-24 TaxID=1895843 RepID=UPI00095D4528|nr:hypothetical protein [Sphingobacterium sp. 40-24]OJZ06469.1 MAG: hypothetical protein BGP15_04285 [Sphingobacterium sp. 40-24]